MKSLFLLVFTLVSFSSFASTVKCDLFGKNEDNKSELIDSMQVGKMTRNSYSFQQRRVINGIDGLMIDMEVMTTKIVSVKILEGTMPFENKEILNLKSSFNDEVSAILSEMDISIVCKKVN